MAFKSRPPFPKRVSVEASISLKMVKLGLGYKFYVSLIRTLVVATFRGCKMFAVQLDGQSPYSFWNCCSVAALRLTVMWKRPSHEKLMHAYFLSSFDPFFILFFRFPFLHYGRVNVYLFLGVDRGLGVGWQQTLYYRIRRTFLIHKNHMQKLRLRMLLINDRAPEIGPSRSATTFA